METGMEPAQNWADRPAKHGRACGQERQRRTGFEAGLPPPSNRLLGAGWIRSTQRPQQATYHTPRTRTQEPRRYSLQAGPPRPASHVRAFQPGAGEAVGLWQGDGHPLPREAEDAGHPRPRPGQGGASTSPARRLAARCTSRPPYGKLKGRPGRAVPVWCARIPQKRWF